MAFSLNAHNPYCRTVTSAPTDTHTQGETTPHIISIMLCMQTSRTQVQLAEHLIRKTLIILGGWRFDASVNIPETTFCSCCSSAFAFYYLWPLPRCAEVRPGKVVEIERWSHQSSFILLLSRRRAVFWPQSSSSSSSSSRQPSLAGGAESGETYLAWVLSKLNESTFERNFILAFFYLACGWCNLVVLISLGHYPERMFFKIQNTQSCVSWLARTTDGRHGGSFSWWRKFSSHRWSGIIGRERETAEIVPTNYSC